MSLKIEKEIKDYYETLVDQYSDWERPFDDMFYYIQLLLEAKSC